MKLILISAIALAGLARSYEPDIVIDANSPGSPPAVTFAGTWSNEPTNLTNAFRGDSKVGTPANAATHAIFKTRLPKAGAYCVFVWGNGGTSEFGYQNQVVVTHADPAPTTLTNYNQYSYPGQWLLVGTFWFEGNDDGSNTCKEAEVKIAGPVSGSYTKLTADAVRFSLATPSMVLDSDYAGVTFAPNSATWPSTPDKSGNAGNIRRANTTNQTATATYTFNVPANDSDYDISLWLPGTSGSWASGNPPAASSFQVEVQHPSVANENPPASTTVTVNLPTVGTNEGQWVRLINPNTANADAPRTGTFRFKATATGLANKVIIKTAGATGSGPGPWRVPADAVRLTKVGDWATIMDEDDPSFPPVPGISGTAGWSTHTGLTPRIWSEWTKSQFGPSWKSFNFTSSTPGPENLTYSPYIPELGLYDIYLWYPPHNGYAPYNSKAMKLSIQTAYLSPNHIVTSTIDQQQGVGGWLHVGQRVLRPSDYGVADNLPKLTIGTSQNPHPPGSSNASMWWSVNSGRIIPDGVLFLRSAENADADNDGVINWFETLVGTDPNNGDSNGNGINDYLELSPIHYPEAATLTLTVTAPSGATIQ